ncbi:DUF2797 domain-containing protein [Motiliproteus sp. SC1-56]|uniref:DUF2797 domain-containing protein n=1 Tax=Motiliproteus sp. SC1-56 TaxID=2799565 RepID=UPI001A8FC27B|nr:DUF2797 domain-containing protein [Motiliproteus sp. SC1-56]
MTVFSHQTEGHLRKMQVTLEGPVSYRLCLDDRTVPLNPLLNEPVRLEYLGEIHCLHCGRLSKKSFSQGYCYPCFKKLPQCDSCIVSPEKCHYHLGTCRDSAWGERHCLQDHIVYLANSSGLKVGITRASQVPTRWIDQGAVQALPILRVASRLQSGRVETLFKEHVADRTNWRAMLKGQVAPLDLAAARDQLFETAREGLNALQEAFGLQAIQPLADAATVDIDYPVLQYPDKVTSFNLDKTPVVEGRLLGIKGQYLILDTGVINIRKFSAYRVAFST